MSWPLNIEQARYWANLELDLVQWIRFPMSEDCHSQSKTQVHSTPEFRQFTEYETSRGKNLVNRFMCKSAQHTVKSVVECNRYIDTVNDSLTVI